MSQDIVKQIEEEAKAEMSYSAKAKKVERAKIDAQLAQIEENERREKELQALDFELPETQAAKLQRNIAFLYKKIENSKKPIRFINDELTDFLQLVPGQVALFGGLTGAGKSTFAANLAYQAILHNKKVLYISGEELEGDIQLRTACLPLGMYSADTSRWTSEQTSNVVAHLAKIGPFLDVVDPSLAGGVAATHVEHFESFLKKQVAKAKAGHQYDLIIIDYFQKISSSAKDPSRDGYFSLSQAANVIDRFKNEYAAPVVVFSQIKNEKKTDVFEEKIKEAKKILTICTTAFEFVADNHKKETAIICHKNRFDSSTVDEKKVLVWNRGLFEFLNEADREKKRREELWTSPAPPVKNLNF